MKKRAVLIESGFLKTQKVQLPGAVEDIKKWQTHLQADYAGAWTPEEIVVLSAPKERDVLKLIKADQGLDFALVVFSGHGFHHDRRELDYVCLNNNENVLVTSFVPSCRSIVVIDACRSIMSSGSGGRATETRSQPTVFADGGAIVSPSKQHYRKFYEDNVLNVQGQALLQSCSVGEVANENPFNGGAYTVALLREAQKWHEQASPFQSPSEEGRIQTIEQAHDGAVNAVGKQFIYQLPEISGAGLHLPFAVRPAS